LPLTRLASVFAPHSPWRAAVVAYGRAAGALPPAPATPPKKKERTKNGNAASLLVATYDYDVNRHACQRKHLSTTKRDRSMVRYT
jgi:hypothetical protein